MYGIREYTNIRAYTHTHTSAHTFFSIGDKKNLEKKNGAPGA